MNELNKNYSKEEKAKILEGVDWVFEQMYRDEIRTGKLQLVYKTEKDRNTCELINRINKNCKIKTRKGTKKPEWLF